MVWRRCPTNEIAEITPEGANWEIKTITETTNHRETKGD